MHKNKVISTTLTCTLLGVNMPNANAMENIIEMTTNEIEEIQEDNFIKNNESIRTEEELIKEKNTQESTENNINEDEVDIDNNIKEILIEETDIQNEKIETRNVTTLQITLNEGENIPDLSNNPDGYTTIVVTTVGNKILDNTDFAKLKASMIPNIDLSNTKATSIPSNAFSSSPWLKSFKFPQGIQTMGDFAFYGCSGLTGNLTIPTSVTTIGKYSFGLCNGLNGNLIIPESITSIGYSAFYGCSGFIGSLIIPDSVTSIGGDAFKYCSGFNGTLTLSNSLTIINDYTFSGCSGFTGNLVIPDSVTKIGENVFYGCNGFNGTLTLSNSLTFIGEDTFEGCSGFTGNLIIPNSVTKISRNAFSECSGFNGTLTLSNSLTFIDEGAFNECSGFTGNLILPTSLEELKNCAFNNCSGFTGDLVIPDSVNSIGYSAFENCTGFDGTLTLGKSISYIDNFAFSGCNRLKGNLILPNSMDYMGAVAFKNCTGLTGDLIIPDSITYLDSSAFEGCSGFNGELILSNNLTTIEDSVFSGCENLIGDVIIPDSVTNFGINIFENCDNVDRIIVKVNESFENKNYRKNIFDNLANKNVLLEMSYNFDTTGTWMDSLDSKYNGKPKINSLMSISPGTVGKLMNLYIPTPYAEEDITVLKDGNPYELLKQNSTGGYIFGEEGTYKVTVTTKAKTVSVIDFQVENLNYKPVINYENNLVSITKQGDDIEGVEFEYRINGGKWQSYNEPFKIAVEDIINDKVKVEAVAIVKEYRTNIEESIIDIKLAKINANNITITQGDEFNPLDNIKAVDIDGSDITKNIKIIKNDVKNNITGKYSVIYQVTGSNDYTITKEIEVIVKEKEIYKITINATDKEIYINDKFNPKDGVTAIDSKNQNLTDKIIVKFNNVDVNKVGVYKVIYEIIDENSQLTTKEIKVTVKENLNLNNDSTVNNSTEKPQTSDISILGYINIVISTLIGLGYINKSNKKY